MSSRHTKPKVTRMEAHIPQWGTGHNDGRRGSLQLHHLVLLLFEGATHHNDSSRYVNLKNGTPAPQEIISNLGLGLNCILKKPFFRSLSKQL